ncbi:MAG: ABC transporter ATP-binding protein [Candidatus Nanohaloarchaea archaeon]
MTAIRAEELRKSYGENEALKGAKLEAEGGEIVGILGPNGAGKSTMMKILTGQIERDSGTAEVLSLDPGSSSIELRERVGILPEREDPPSFLTVREYLEMVSEVRETSIDIRSWRERLNLEGKMESLTKELSKGERQKLMVVQALFHEPEAVFVDEPLINLDPIIQEEVKDLFRERSSDGTTVVLSTHVVSLAEELCDRVYFLRDGRTIDEVTEMENLKERFLEEE